MIQQYIKNELKRAANNNANNWLDSNDFEEVSHKIEERPSSVVVTVTGQKEGSEPVTRSFEQKMF